MSARAARLLDRLQAALDAERGHLVSGRFDALAEAAARRESEAEALADLDAADLSGFEGRLARLRRSAARNLDLLRAALDGAAAGRRRFAEIADARRRLVSYDRSGAPVERGGGPEASRRA